MNSNQFARHLAKIYKILIEKKPGGGGHRLLINPANGRRSELPMHGSNKQLGTGIKRKIMKELGLS